MAIEYGVDVDVIEQFINEELEMAHRRDTAFDLTSEIDEAGVHAVATINCSECVETASQRLRGGKTLNPEMITKRFRMMGWDADRHSRRLCRCPKHAKRGSEKMERGMPHPAAHGAPANVPPTPRQALLPPKATAQAAVTPPTGEQRVKIRGLLDANFDDKAGKYLGGYSDHKVALEAGVAAQVVAAIREVGYGPIKEDDDVTEIRKEIDTARQDVERINTRLDGLLARLVGVEKKVGLR